MEYSIPTIPEEPNGRVAPRLLSGRVLTRLIEFSFSSQEPSYTFRDAFRDFAKAYFTLSREGGIQFRYPTSEEPAIEVLARVYDEAVASGQLAPLAGSPRLLAFTTLTSLATLQPQVTEGALTLSEAVDLVTTMVFEGLEPSSPRGAGAS